jgi:hypothetical protein
MTTMDQEYNVQENQGAAPSGTCQSRCSMPPGIEQCAVVQGILYGTQRFTMAECRDLSITLLAAIDIIDGRTTEASNAAGQTPAAHKETV